METILMNSIGNRNTIMNTSYPDEHANFWNPLNEYYFDCKLSIVMKNVRAYILFLSFIVDTIYKLKLINLFSCVKFIGWILLIQCLLIKIANMKCHLWGKSYMTWLFIYWGKYEITKIVDFCTVWNLNTGLDISLYRGF